MTDNTQRQTASVKEVFTAFEAEATGAEEKLATALSPEAITKIQDAFVALEDALLEVFPNSARLSYTLRLLEGVATYVMFLLRKGQ